MGLPFGSRSSLLYGGVEEGIAEEVHGAAEDHPGVVAGLEAGNQQGVLADCMGVLEERHDDIIKESIGSLAQEPPVKLKKPLQQKHLKKECT